MKTLERLTRGVPDGIRERLYYRLFHAHQGAFRDRYAQAALTYAPGCRMYDLVPGDVISGQIVINGFYQLALSRALCGYARDGGVLLDVGANLGYFSLLWAGASDSNRAIAVEADRRNIERFRENVRRNGLGDRVRLIPKAAGDRPGPAEFEVGPCEQTGWGGLQIDGVTERTVTVEVVCLDDAIRGEEIQVVKIDVEGGELAVVRGAQEILALPSIRAVFFEENEVRQGRLGIQPGSVQRELSALGYESRQLIRGGDDWVATRRSDRIRE